MALGGGATPPCTEAWYAGHWGGGLSRLAGSSRISTEEVSKWMRSCSQPMGKAQALEVCQG